MPLAESLDYASGFYCTYEFLNILEKFGIVQKSLYLSTSLLPSPFSNNDPIRKGVEIFQIELTNPHFHEEKGMKHIKHLMKGSLFAIHNNKIYNNNIELPNEIKKQLFLFKVGTIVTYVVSIAIVILIIQ